LDRYSQGNKQTNKLITFLLAPVLACTGKHGTGKNGTDNKGTNGKEKKNGALMSNFPKPKFKLLPLKPQPKLKSQFPNLNLHAKHPTLPYTLILKMCHFFLLCHLCPYYRYHYYLCHFYRVNFTSAIMTGAILLDTLRYMMVKQYP